MRKQIGCGATIILGVIAACITDSLFHNITLAIVVGLAACIVCGLIWSSFFEPK